MLPQVWCNSVPLTEHVLTTEFSQLVRRTSWSTGGRRCGGGVVLVDRAEDHVRLEQVYLVQQRRPEEHAHGTGIGFGAVEHIGAAFACQRCVCRCR